MLAVGHGLGPHESATQQQTNKQTNKQTNNRYFTSLYQFMDLLRKFFLFENRFSFLTAFRSQFRVCLQKIWGLLVWKEIV
jgi:hypothetical protein